MPVGWRNCCGGVRSDPHWVNGLPSGDSFWTRSLSWSATMMFPCESKSIPSGDSNSPGAAPHSPHSASWAPDGESLTLRLVPESTTSRLPARSSTMLVGAPNVSCELAVSEEELELRLPPHWARG